MLRESVRELMRRDGLARFSRFAVWESERLEVPLLAFVAEVERVDPARMLDLDMRVTQEKLDLLNGGAKRVLDACRTSQSTRFQTPRIQRPRGATLSYEVGKRRRGTGDARLRVAGAGVPHGELDGGRAQAANARRARSCEERRRSAHGATRPALRLGRLMSETRLRWRRRGRHTMVPLTRKFQLAIGEDAVAALAPATNVKSSTVIRWRSRSEIIGIDAQESRWWADVEEDVAV